MNAFTCGQPGKTQSWPVFPQASSTVGEEGFEPSHPFGHTDLNRARLRVRFAGVLTCADVHRVATVGRRFVGSAGVSLARSLAPTIDAGRSSNDSAPRPRTLRVVVSYLFPRGLAISRVHRPGSTAAPVPMSPTGRRDEPRTWRVRAELGQSWVRRGGEELEANVPPDSPTARRARWKPAHGRCQVQMAVNTRPGTRLSCWRSAGCSRSLAEASPQNATAGSANSEVAKSWPRRR